MLHHWEFGIPTTQKKVADRIGWTLSAWQRFSVEFATDDDTVRHLAVPMITPI